jgi:hypothetical protein
LDGAIERTAAQRARREEPDNSPPCPLGRQTVENGSEGLAQKRIFHIGSAMKALQ